MKFYPDPILYRHYTKNLPESHYFSARVPDRTIKNSLDNINRAINVCEKNDSFLDFGAGNGRYSSALLPEFKKGYGIEIEKDEFLSRMSKEHKNYTALFGKSVMKNIKEKIDFILLMDVIEHIPLNELPRFVKNIIALQDQGGVIYICTPNAIRCGVVEKSGIYFKRFLYGHHKHYVMPELVDLFESYGYRPVIVAYEDFRFRIMWKQLNVGLSYLDKKLLAIPFYSILSFPFIAVANIIFSVMEPVVAWDEYRNRSDDFSSRSILLTLKRV